VLQAQSHSGLVVQNDLRALCFDAYGEVYVR